MGQNDKIREAAGEIYGKTRHYFQMNCGNEKCYEDNPCSKCSVWYEEEITRIMGIIEGVNK